MTSNPDFTGRKLADDNAFARQGADLTACGRAARCWTSCGSGAG